MKDWSVTLISLVMLIILIAMAVYLWRVGKGQKRYFSADFWVWVFVMPIICQIPGGIMDWYEGEPIAPLKPIRWIAVLCIMAIIGALYTGGFLHGLRQRLKNDGIIGYSR